MEAEQSPTQTAKAHQTFLYMASFWKRTALRHLPPHLPTRSQHYSSAPRASSLCLMGNNHGHPVPMTRLLASPLHRCMLGSATPRTLPLPA